MTWISCMQLGSLRMHQSHTACYAAKQPSKPSKPSSLPASASGAIMCLLLWSAQAAWQAHRWFAEEQADCAGVARSSL